MAACVGWPLLFLSQIFYHRFECSLIVHITLDVNSMQLKLSSKEQPGGQTVPGYLENGNARVPDPQ